MKKKVLIVGAKPPKIGGVVTVIETISKSNLISKEFEIVRIDITSNSEFLHTDKQSFDLRHVARRLWTLCCLLLKVLRTRPLFIHYNACPDYSFLSDFLNILTLRLIGWRVVLHYLNDPTSEFTLFPAHEIKSWRNSIFALTVRLSALCIVLGQKFKDMLETRFELTNIVILHNCFVASEVPAARVDHDAEGALKVLYLARLSELKGVYDLLKVAQMCQERNLAIEFLVAGGYNSPADKEMTETFIREYGLRNIQMKGVVSDIDKKLIMSSVDVLLFPSKYEGFPMSILEAASYSVPSIVYDIGMMDEIVKDRKTGLVVAKGDIQGLFEGLRYLLANPDVKTALGNNAAKDAKNRFSREAFERTLLGYYQKVTDMVSN